ncbi:MAG: aliphatic sulfonate ABC transporter substrate-binding protein [Cyanobacteriota bacterium]|nr:aliphatic sulfonate ABC transporter substrate-binding protein [Cyanobacteriota bacterium]
MMNVYQRREILRGLGLGVAATLAFSSRLVNQNVHAQTQRSNNEVEKIGYQRFSELDLLRFRGELEKRIGEQGWSVEWVFFQSGPPMLEALNAGSLDFGGVGETPPIFAQAAGTQFYYLASTPRGALTQDIVVPKDSPIQTVADLKGKKVALQKGSSAHYLLIAVLQEQNIPIDEVEIVSLSPADARSAFEQRNVDAWSIWDPFLAVIEGTNTVRNLKQGRERRAFFLASQTFVRQFPEVVKTILQEAKVNEVWGQQNTRQIAEIFAKDLKIDPAILEIANQRRNWGLLPINEVVVAAQQEVADIFYQLKIIPKAIDIKEVTVPIQEYSQLIPS